MSTQEAVEHFLRCANNGAHKTGSTGERIANRIALALAELDDDLQTVDEDIIIGAAIVMKRMNGPFQTDDDKQAVYRDLHAAANGDLEIE